MKRRAFLQTMGAAAASGMVARVPLGSPAKKLQRIGLETAKVLGHEFLVVPDFEDWTKQTLDDWREWADRFNAAGAVARKAGIWLGFHNEAYHQKPIDGQIPL